jgi:hypothetical protein
MTTHSLPTQPSKMTFFAANQSLPTRCAMKRAFLAVTVVGALCLAASVQAAEAIIFSQNGSDVVATASGSLDLTSFSADGRHNNQPGGILDTRALVVGNTGTGTIDYHAGISGPSLNLNSGSDVVATSGSGFKFGVFPSLGFLWTEEGYVSGTSLASTSTWSNTTIAQLGLANGLYTYTWGSGAHADSLTIQIPVPEPTAFSMFGAAGLAVVAFLRPRRSASASR